MHPNKTYCSTSNQYNLGSLWCIEPPLALPKKTLFHPLVPFFLLSNMAQPRGYERGREIHPLMDLVVCLGFSLNKFFFLSSLSLMVVVYGGSFTVDPLIILPLWFLLWVHNWLWVVSMARYIGGDDDNIIWNYLFPYLSASPVVHLVLVEDL